MESSSHYPPYSYDSNSAHTICEDDYSGSTWSWYSDYSSYSSYSTATLTEQAVVSTVFGLITLIGLLGNFTVIFVTFRSRSMRGVTNIFIMNNAISDILFLLLCVPITALQFVLDDWMFGSVVCKFFAYIQHVAVQASCATLVAMTLDRYKVILQPMESLTSRTVTRTTLTNLFIWAVSLLIHVPSLVFFNTLSTNCEVKRYCGIEASTYQYFVTYEIFSKFTVYIIPFIIMSFCYLRIVKSVWNKYQLASLHNAYNDTRRRQKVKVTQMTVLVVLLFGICWGPLHIIHLEGYIGSGHISVSRNFHTFLLCLAYSNAALNPFVYALTGRYYREILHQACFTDRVCTKKRRSALPPTSTTRVNGARRPSLEVPSEPKVSARRSPSTRVNINANEQLSAYLSAKENKANEESPLRKIPDIDQDLVNHRAEILRRKYSLDDDCV